MNIICESDLFLYWYIEGEVEFLFFNCSDSFIVFKWGRVLMLGWGI